MMKIRMKSRRASNSAIRSTAIAGAMFLVVALFSSCQPNPTILKDVVPPVTPLSPADVKKTTFAEDLAELKAGYDFVLVYRRRDGAVFDNEDRKYLRQNSPLETSSWISSDEGKAFISGAGFAFPPEQMKALEKRFIIEDHSRPEAKEAARQQANSNNAVSNKPKKEK